MAIINRIKRLFRADMNAVLDLVEEPDAVLKQAIRDMQETLDRKRGQLVRSEKNLETLNSAEVHQKEKLSKIQGDLELCLREGSEELARKTIARKLSYQKHLEAVQRQISRLEKLREQQTREIALQQNQLESIMEKAELYVRNVGEESAFSVAESILNSAETDAVRTHPGAGSVHVTEEEIELEWIRIREGGES